VKTACALTVQFSINSKDGSMVINVKVVPYEEQKILLPDEGIHFVAHEQDDVLTFYAAFNDSIANYAVENQHFGGHTFSFNRMTWIKPSFMWMMYRSKWGTAENQERILALHVKKQDVVEILNKGVLSTFDAAIHADEATWKKDLRQSKVRIQWDPDHDENGFKLNRKAIQIGLKGHMLRKFATELHLHIEDITAFVSAQRTYKCTKEGFLVPQEKVIDFEDKFYKIRL
jgi:Domain of unknown function (DUF4291)